MKKILKFIKRAAESFWVRLVLLLGCVVIIFALSGAFESAESAGAKIVELITSVDTLSLFLVAALSLIVADVVIKIKGRLEESNKTDDDHHKIVCKYHGHVKPAHKPNERDFSNDLYDKAGELMYLRTVPERSARKRAKNPVKDVWNKTDTYRKNDIEDYTERGELNLPSVAVFTNVLGDATVKFDDTSSAFVLPRFVRDNALKLMEAHKASKVANSVTVRLKDIEYENGTLTLFTERSEYFDMLLTNRCMDYRLDDSVSLRDKYEFNDVVTPLAKSELGNQIGINGLIFTRDGYLLIEKRGNKKTTWKDKFAQPISLAMKLGDTGLKRGEAFGAEPSVAETTFKKIVLGTVRRNFGLEEKHLKGFCMSNNFMGIARDLLEGGKPNMYFYVVADMTADELALFLENKCRMASVYSAELKAAERAARKHKKPPESKSGLYAQPLPKLTRDKLDSDYYLINYADIEIDYNYVFDADMRKLKPVKRDFSPKSGARELQSGVGAPVNKRGGRRRLKKECGEALLACLYFADACSERIDKQLDPAARIRFEERSKVADV